jgi:hypothetical protein
VVGRGRGGVEERLIPLRVCQVIFFHYYEDEEPAVLSKVKECIKTANSKKSSNPPPVQKQLLEVVLYKLRFRIAVNNAVRVSLSTECSPAVQVVPGSIPY